MIIRTANTETQSAVGHVPKERFEKLSRGIRHTVRAQLAQYENAIGRSEWIIGRHHAVAVGGGINQSAMGYGKLFSRPYALPQVMVADNQRPEHADSPIGTNQRCRNVTTMTD